MIIIRILSIFLLNIHLKQKKDIDNSNIERRRQQRQQELNRINEMAMATASKNLIE